MKIFKFKYSKIATAFIYLGLALAATAFALNLYYLLTEGIDGAYNPAYPIIRYVLMFFVSILLAVILISLLVSSYYAVGDGVLKTSFGIIKSKYKLTDIENIILDRETNKLILQFKTQTFISVVVKPEWYEDFVNALLEKNPDINYSVKSKENTPDDNEKKK